MSNPLLNFMFIFSVNRYQPVKYVTPQVEHIRHVPLQTGGSKENALSNIKSQKTVYRAD